MVHILFVAIFALSFYKNGKSKKIFLTSFLILYVFSVLRFRYGNDYIGYFEKFEQIQNGENPFGLEILFYLLNLITGNYFVFIAFTSIGFLLAAYFLIIQNVDKHYTWYALVVYLINPYIFLMSLSAIRQTLATVLFIFALEYSRKRRMIEYGCLIALAVLIHKSAIVLLPLYFIANERRITNAQIIVYSFLVIFFVYSEDLFKGLVSLALKVFNDPNYYYYFASDTSNSLRATLLSSMYFIYVAYNIPRLRSKTLLYAKMYLIGQTCVLFAYQLSMMTRFQIYFDIFSIVALPMIVRTYWEPYATVIDGVGDLWNHSKKNVEEIRFYLLNRLEIVKPKNKWQRLLWLGNAVVFPCGLLLIYFARYYSFFSNPMWLSFVDYKTIFHGLFG